MRTTSLGVTNFLTIAADKAAPDYIHHSAKRAFDLAVALPALLIAGPVILLFAALVRLTSRGPAFYVQERVGWRGIPFPLLKLRTMRVDAESGDPVWALPDDPRVTPFGNFLRRLHLDELPQLLNVIRGEMSLIGPRPERPFFVRKLARTIPDYETRLLARPGITGLAQIHQHADQTLDDVRTKLTYDLEYIRRACLALDLQIIALTAARVLARRRASV